MAKKEKKIELPDFYFSVQVLLLRLTGIEVLEKYESILYRIYSIIIILFTSTYVLVECVELTFHSDFEIIGVIGCYIITHVLTLVKVAVIYRNRKEFGDLMRSFHEGYYKPNRTRGGKFEEQCISGILRQSSFQMTQYGIFILIVVVAGFMSSLQSRFTQPPEKWILPFIPLSFVDITHSPTFEITYIYQGLATCIICAWVYICDSTVICIVAQTVAQLKILENSIRNYKCRGLKMQGEEEVSVSNILHETIKHHINLLETIDMVEYICSYLVLCVFLANLIILCLVMYFTSLAPVQSLAFVKYLLYSTAIVVQLFLYCWWGNEMTLANEALALGIFETYHPDDPISHARALNFMLVKAQKILFLTAGKFVPLSLETYKGIIKGSFSYFTVLRNVNNK